MTIEDFGRVTIITTTLDKYLALKNFDDSEKIIGKPKRIILGNDGRIPEFIEKEEVK